MIRPQRKPVAPSYFRLYFRQRAALLSVLAYLRWQYGKDSQDHALVSALNSAETAYMCLTDVILAVVQNLYIESGAKDFQYLWSMDGTPLFDEITFDDAGNDFVVPYAELVNSQLWGDYVTSFGTRYTML